MWMDELLKFDYDKSYGYSWEKSTLVIDVNHEPL